MIKIAINGINGKMGNVVAKAVNADDNVQLVCGFDSFNDEKNICKVYKNFNECNEEIDVIIDFSHPSSFKPLMDYAVATKTNVVVATTGLCDNDKILMKESSQNIAIFFSANMSLGVNLLIDLVKQASKVLYGDYDIEIIEKHHNQKIDAPSGTALMIADEIAKELDDNVNYVYDRHSVRKKREKREIGIHSIRGGTIVGEHEVIFAGKDEFISITHQATSKEIFATGSLGAAKFLSTKKTGLYSMKDMFI